MFLKRVEIQGFKSFANRVNLEFLSDEKGGKITAVVGPNGSGKSNVADAIRWVMGEQSMKNLRGKKSEDVIFAGSGKKARLGSASVSLHLDNSDKKIPLEFSEVIIARRLFRSGDSEYLINNSRVRLIDVVDLLAKAGIGRESYSVITQGMSDAVLNASPAERKSILEEAAGVKEYQIKKDRSLKKLDSTEENLEKARALIAEIEPHLKILKRQSEKALRGKEISDKLREKQKIYFSFLWHEFQEERNVSLEEKERLGSAMMNAQREMDILNDAVSKESKIIEDFNRQSDLEKKREILYLKINALERELTIAQVKLEVEKNRQIEEKMVKSVPVDLKYVRQSLEKIRGSQELLINRLKEVESLEELQDIKERARSIQQELYELYESAGKKEIREEIENPQYEESLRRKNAAIDGWKKEIEKVQKEIDGLKKDASDIIQQIESEREKSRQSRMKFFELEKKLRARQESLNLLKDEFNESKIKLARVEVREEDLIGQVKEELHGEISDLKYSGEKIDRNDYEKEIAKLRFQMEQSGGIDPMVLDEYEETKKRFEFLTNEVEDLEKAIESLREVIRELENKIEKSFRSAFEEIDKEFSKYFKIIFGGGNASLKKIKSAKSLKPKNGENGEAVENNDGSESEEALEEGLENGIEISACPPGKKISSLSMLSGGERSLTSLALLFAIISYNPPPFAVLDEVEAALDEANSRRFSRILQELSERTQFIAITHNRETMRQATLLYGVTMGEDGISKILSVRLDQVKEGGKIDASPTNNA